MPTPDETTTAQQPDQVVTAFAARIGRNLEAVAGHPREIMILIIGAAAACWMTDRAAFKQGHALALADLALEHLGLAPAVSEPAPAVTDPAARPT